MNGTVFGDPTTYSGSSRDSNGGGSACRTSLVLMTTFNPIVKSMKGLLGFHYLWWSIRCGSARAR